MRMMRKSSEIEAGKDCGGSGESDKRSPLRGAYERAGALNGARVCRDIYADVVGSSADRKDGIELMRGTKFGFAGRAQELFAVSMRSMTRRMCMPKQQKTEKTK